MMTRKISTIEYPGDSKLMLWIRDHMGYPHQYCCLIWPFARLRQGYAGIGRNGKQIYVHRFMCELRHGPAPTDKHQAAHSCNRGNDGCVNPLHLSWKTPRENQLDRTDNAGQPARKLTPEQVDKIRALKGREHTQETARRFNTGETNVRRIQAGLTWKRDRADYRIWAPEEILRIRSTPQADGVTKGFAKSFTAHLHELRLRSGSNGSEPTS